MVLERIKAADDVRGMVQKILSVFGQHQGIAFAVKEVTAKLLLKPADGTAQSLLRDKQAVGSLRNASEFADLQKISHLTDIHRGSLLSFPPIRSVSERNAFCGNNKNISFIKLARNLQNVNRFCTHTSKQTGVDSTLLLKSTRKKMLYPHNKWIAIQAFVVEFAGFCCLRFDNNEYIMALSKKRNCVFC